MLYKWRKWFFNLQKKTICKLKLSFPRVKNKTNQKNFKYFIEDLTLVSFFSETNRVFPHIDALWEQNLFREQQLQLRRKIQIFALHVGHNSVFQTVGQTEINELE